MSWWNDLDFGDVGGWIGGVAGLGALVITGLARKDSKSSAATAKLAQEDSQRSADAAVRSADAEEAALALGRESAAAAAMEVKRSADAAVKAAEAADRSAVAAEERVALIKAANEYRYAWVIRQHPYDLRAFEVQNAGAEAAHQVKISRKGAAAPQPDHWVSIAAGNAEPSFIHGTFADPVTVSWRRAGGEPYSTEVVPELVNGDNDAPDWDRR